MKFQRPWAYAMLACSALWLNGCASGATAEGMSVRAPELKARASAEMTKTVAVGEVKGGGETNPLWMSDISNDDFKKALVSSLRTAGLLADTATTRYRLRVSLDALDRPVFGGSMTVTSKIHYTVVDAKSGAVVLDETVTTPYTATFGDSLVGVTRLRIATEGSARKSIAALIEKLNKPKPADRAGAVSLRR